MASLRRLQEIEKKIRRSPVFLLGLLSLGWILELSLETVAGIVVDARELRGLGIKLASADLLLRLLRRVTADVLSVAATLLTRLLEGADFIRLPDDLERLFDDDDLL